MPKGRLFSLTSIVLPLHSWRPTLCSSHHHHTWYQLECSCPFLWQLCAEARRLCKVRNLRLGLSMIVDSHAFAPDVPSCGLLHASAGGLRGRTNSTLSRVPAGLSDDDGRLCKTGPQFVEAASRLSSGILGNAHALHAYLLLVQAIPCILMRGVLARSSSA